MQARKDEPYAGSKQESRWESKQETTQEKHER